MNDAGTAVGYAQKYVSGAQRGTRAVRWDASGTAATELGNLGTSNGVTSAVAFAVNDAGTAVGVSDKYVPGPGGYRGLRAVRWDASGTAATELGDLGTDSSGSTVALAYAVNDAGTAVGNSQKYVSGSNVGVRAVIWLPDASAIDLNDLGVVANPNDGTWLLEYASGMSSDGWVAGTGTFTPNVGPAYTRHWVAQVGLGGEWTDDFTGSLNGTWGRGPQWSTGTPAMQVGDATFSANASYTVSLDRNETTRSIDVEAGDVTLNLNSYTLTSLTGMTIASGASLWAADAGTIVSTGGVEVFAGGSVHLEDMTIHLGSSALSVNLGAEVEYDGATVNGGLLLGTGSHRIVTGGTSAFSGVISLGSTTITQDGEAVFTNFTNFGALVNNAPLSFGSVENSGSGTITVNDTLDAQVFVNYGVVNVTSGGAINHSLSDLVAGGGSRTTVYSGGTIDLASGTTMELDGSLLVNNGDINGTLNVNDGSLAGGTGSFDTVNITNGGTIAPGNGPGAASLQSAGFGAGGRYSFEIRDAFGAAGVGTDIIDIADELIITAGNTPNSQFVISVASLDASNQPGPADNFNPSLSYSFLLATADGGITGFAPDLFRVDASDFEHDLEGGSFEILQSDNDLILNFDPASTILPGDFNSDGPVDAADYIVWRKNVLPPAELNTWRANFGRTLGGDGTGAAVPEPGSVAMVIGVVGMVMGMFGRRGGGRQPQCGGR